MRGHIAFALAGALVVAAGISDADMEAHKEVNYCEMHRIYLETNGEYGWPDYNRNYTDRCRDEAVRG